MTVYNNGLWNVAITGNSPGLEEAYAQGHYVSKETYQIPKNLFSPEQLKQIGEDASTATKSFSQPYASSSAPVTISFASAATNSSRPDLPLIVGKHYEITLTDGNIVSGELSECHKPNLNQLSDWQGLYMNGKANLNYINAKKIASMKIAQQATEAKTVTEDASAPRIHYPLKFPKESGIILKHLLETLPYQLSSSSKQKRALNFIAKVLAEKPLESSSKDSLQHEIGAMLLTIKVAYMVEIGSDKSLRKIGFLGEEAEKSIANSLAQLLQDNPSNAEASSAVTEEASASTLHAEPENLSPTERKAALHEKATELQLQHILLSDAAAQKAAESDDGGVEETKGNR